MPMLDAQLCLSASKIIEKALKCLTFYFQDVQSNLVPLKYK